MLQYEVIPLLAGAPGQAAEESHQSALDEPMKQQGGKHQNGEAAKRVDDEGQAEEPARQTVKHFIHGSVVG